MASKYGYYVNDIVAMIRQKVEDHRADLIKRVDINMILHGDSHTAMVFSELKGAIRMADEIIDELTAEEGDQE